MTDFLGALELPIPAPGPNDTVADPFLDLLAGHELIFLHATRPRSARTVSRCR